MDCRRGLCYHCALQFQCRTESQKVQLPFRFSFPTAACLAAGFSLFLAGAASAAESCKETTLPGSWKSAQSGNVWTFHSDGKLSCQGSCAFTQVTGQPISWAYEPNANVWSSPIDHVMLVFEKITFDGVFGSFRCQIDEGGRTLQLLSEEEAAMVFTRQ